MSPKPKPPRPVTAWVPTCNEPPVLDIEWGVFRTAREANSMVEYGEPIVRCRVTPIRPPTDAEITKLALHLANVEHAAMVAAGHRRPGKVVGAGSGFIAVAREAWRRGCR